MAKAKELDIVRAKIGDPAEYGLEPEDVVVESKPRVLPSPSAKSELLYFPSIAALATRYIIDGTLMADEKDKLSHIFRGCDDWLGTPQGPEIRTNSILVGQRAALYCKDETGADIYNGNNPLAEDRLNNVMRLWGRKALNWSERRACI